jgi:hypothetical protein
MAHNLVPKEPTLIVIIVSEGNLSTALEQNLVGQKFKHGRDVLTFVPRRLMIQDTEFFQQGIENLFSQKD